MDWLSQNWIWIALAVGAWFVMSRMGIGGCGMGHTGGHGSNQGQSGPGGVVHPSANQTLVRTNPVDPVTRRTLPADPAISSVYRGHAYYFENRENRDAFERDPEKYVAAIPTAGAVIQSSNSSAKPAYRGHGCC